ncbi:hypothetical protein BgiBS90_025795, partial [Biomphalaria glabrata]
ILEIMLGACDSPRTPQGSLSLSLSPRFICLKRLGRWMNLFLDTLLDMMMRT